MMIVPIVVVPADDHEDHDNHDRHDDHDELGQVKMMIVSCFNMFLQCQISNYKLQFYNLK